MDWWGYGQWWLIDNSNWLPYVAAALLVGLLRWARWR